MALVVTGSIGFDTIETPRDRAEKILGGSCTYFAAAASFSGPVRIVGAVGGDFNDEHRRVLSSFKSICTEGLELRPKSQTFAWGGRYHENLNMRDTIFTHLGVLEEAPPPVPLAYKTSDFVFLANTHPKVQLGFMEQFPERKLTVADTMNLWINIAKDELTEVIKRVDGLVINSEEAELFTRIAHPVTSARKILELGPRFVVIKRGEFGAILVHQDGIALLPAYPTEKLVDPTGCGDSFAGGLMAVLAQNYARNSLHSPSSFENVRAALAHATVIASFTIEGMGLGGLETLTSGALETRLEDYRGMVNVRALPAGFSSTKSTLNQIEISV